MDNKDQQASATPPEPVIAPTVVDDQSAPNNSEFLKYNFISSEVFNKKAIFNALIGLKSMSATPTYGELGDICNVGGVIYVCTVASKTAPTWQPLLSTAFDYQVFTATGSGAWTKPSRASATSMVRVEMWGGGGGGGGKTGGIGANTTDGGGGGGEYSEGTFRASDLNSTVSLVVGAGGAGGIGSNNNGVAGGSSSFGTTLVVARGGSGGSGTNSNGGAGAGYFPGLGTTANPQNALDMFSGGAGGQGSLSANGGNAYKGGGGGAGGGNSAPGGTSAQAGAGGDTPSGNGDGNPGNAPAGAGAGASQNGGSTVRTGGAGARGEIRIWTFY